MEVLSTTCQWKENSHNVTYIHKRIPTANVLEPLEIVGGKRRATHGRYSPSSHPFPSQAGR